MMNAPIEKIPVPINGGNQWILGEEVHPKMNNPIGIKTAPKIDGGKKISGVTLP